MVKLNKVIPSSKIRPDNLDFVFGVSNLDQYFIPSLVLVQSILENNLWANQIQISIFYENWSAEQKDAYEQLIDNFNRSQGRNFAILKLYDAKKIEFNTGFVYHNSQLLVSRIAGLKLVEPISNWVFLIEVNELNVRSLKPLLHQLNRDFSNCWAVMNYSRRILNAFNGSYISQYTGGLFIFNNKFIHKKNGIVERYITTYQKLQNTYPNSFDKSWMANPENFLGAVLENCPIGVLNTVQYIVNPQVLVSETIFFAKWNSRFLAPWHQEFPDNSLKQLWLEYASKNLMSKDFQIPYPFEPNDGFPKKAYDLFIAGIFNIYFPLLHLIGKVSPKIFQKFFSLTLRPIQK